MQLQSSEDRVAGAGHRVCGVGSTLASVETPDKYTVIMKSDTPWPGMFKLLALFNIADPVTMQANGDKTPAGTGPFKFGEYAQGDHLSLIRNPNYWDQRKPYLDGVTFSIFANGQSMITSLEGGALDVANQPPLPDVVRLNSDSGSTSC
jgi:peptide/nickel transport system substrate-binding protein